MGAVIAFLLVLSTLTACTGGTMTDVKNALPPELSVPLITYEVALEPHENTAHDEDGALLATCSYEVPVLRALREDGTEILEPLSPKEEEAAAVAAAFNGQFTAWAAEEDFHELTENARADRALRQESGVESPEDFVYTAELTCEVYRQGDLVSITAAYYSYTGGVHPNTVLLSWNFDLGAGTFFTPEALAEDSQEFLTMVTEEIVLQAQARAAEAGVPPETFFWENYQEIAGDWSSCAVSFDEAGMTVGYSPYEMAAYAAGAQTFFLPYEQMQPYCGEHGLALLGLN